jgi:hypothetical protein
MTPMSTAVSAPASVSVSPAPSDEEAAAIVAAMEALWPKPVVLVSVGVDESARNTSWRFSGRWWNKPAPQARQRPWR